MSVGGMLVTALMLGIVSETISDKIEDLKKGTSDVLEDNHRCGMYTLSSSNVQQLFSVRSAMMRPWQHTRLPLRRLH